ncbi:hypothetical protein AX16_004916 [Volvariella volvacea WC 439]|nr:hypothetical protein AX16_004916 [Volvariella volvacea WC 439]
MALKSLWALALCTVAARAGVTVYSQVPLAQQTASDSAPGAEETEYIPVGLDPDATVLPAYNDTMLDPPPPPNPPIQTAFTLNLQADAANVVGLSIPQRGDFFGFSVEMSVITQVLGRNSTHLHVPFLNFVGNLQQRAGQARIRLGGNTQEFASHVDYIPDHRAVAKETDVDPRNPTLTPSTVYTDDLFYMMGNISALVNLEWFLGIPFNDTTNWRLQIAELAQNILGDRLAGLQAGNEPDLYAAHHHRPETYNQYDYFGEVAQLIDTIEANPNIPVKDMLVAPSLATGDWWPELVWDTGFLDAFQDHIRYIAMEHYPNNNCFFQFGLGRPVYPQEVFEQYLTHEAGINLIQIYLNTSAIAQRIGKPFLMFETNTASCGGFHGISDSYGASLWALDYGMQMAYSNFSGAFLHVGGQNVFYNPFTSPPTNQSAFNQWTVGAVYYSALVISEVFGPTNTSRIIDLLGNDANPLTPQYAIYENDRLARVALFNYITDPSGANDYVATITVEGGQVPAEVRVKYLEADTVSTKDIRWAGQTFGPKFTVDGRLKGTLNVVTIACDQSANECRIPVPAPGFALVFLADSPALGYDESSITFSTTAHTKTRNTATVDPSLLATSNGSSGKDRDALGSTSPGSVNAGRRRGDVIPGLSVLAGLVGGAWLVLRAARW